MAENKETNTVNISEILETLFGKKESEPKFKSLEELVISVANKFKNNRKGGSDSSEIEYITHKCIIFDNYQQYKEFKKTDKTGCNGWSKEFKELIDWYNQNAIKSLGLNSQNIYTVDDMIQYFKSMYPLMKDEFGVDSLDLFIDICFVMMASEGGGTPIVQIDKWNTNCWNCIGGIVNIETGTNEDDGNGRGLGDGTVTGIVTTNSNNCEFTYDINKKLNDWMNGGYISLLAQSMGKTEEEVLALIEQMGGMDENQIKITFVMPLIADMGDHSLPGSHKLINCLNCLNCLKCQECTNCKNCEECNSSSNDIVTSDCENCKQCNGCKNCINCVVCTECNKCLNCYNECSGCIECNNCNNCNDCNGCINCEQCENCEKCSGCANCSNSEECIKCNTCDTCYDCRECTELENVQCRYKTWYKKDYYKK